ncbi:MAG: hypothetical protein WD036_08705, partial [Bauldia sp.]
MAEADAATWRRNGGRAASALVVLAALVVAGCSSGSGTGGPTAAIFGDPAGTAPIAGRSRIDSEEHARIVAAYGGIYHDDKVEQTLV